MADETTQIKKEIQNDAAEALRVLSRAKEESVHAIACAAADAKKAVDLKSADDHDTITNLVGAVGNIDQKFTEKFAELRGDIKEIKDGTAKRIDDLEREKNNVKSSYIVLFKEGVDKSITDIEADIVALKLSRSNQNVTMGIGIVILTTLVGLLVVHMFK